MSIEIARSSGGILICSRDEKKFGKLYKTIGKPKALADDLICRCGNVVGIRVA